MSETVTFEDFEKLDIRMGRVIDVQPFLEGRYSTHILMIDLGTELGINRYQEVPGETHPELRG